VKENFIFFIKREKKKFSFFHKTGFFSEIFVEKEFCNKDENLKRKIFGHKFHK